MKHQYLITKSGERGIYEEEGWASLLAYRIYWDQKHIKPTSFLEKLVLVKELKGIKQDCDCSRQNKFYPDSHFYRKVTALSIQVHANKDNIQKRPGRR